jgi:hypothetical protein
VKDWEGLRTIAVIVAWITVVGGALLAALWIGFGGGRAIGPEDELMAQAGVSFARSERRYTALSSAQVGLHALFGNATAGLLTYPRPGLTTDVPATSLCWSLPRSPSSSVP